MIQPLEPYQGSKFIEPTNDKEEPKMLDQIYRLTIDRLYRLTIGKREDYINPTIKGFVSWRSINSSYIGPKANGIIGSRENMRSILDVALQYVYSIGLAQR